MIFSIAVESMQDPFFRKQLVKVSAVSKVLWSQQSTAASTVEDIAINCVF